MPCESFILVQTILLVVIVSWAKAGLAEWSGLFIATTIGIGLIVAPLLRRRETGGHPEIPWKASFPVLIFAVLGLAGFLNPTFRNPAESFAYAEKEELEILAKREFAMRGDPEFVDRVMREMHFFRQQADERHKDRALARFLLATRYVSNHPQTTLQPLFDRYLKDMRIDASHWMPSTVAKKTSWSKLYPLVLVFLQGIWVHAYLRNRRSMRCLLGVLALNCVLLAGAGIVQKLSYDPTAHRPEIWGVWEAPEPRYYFASFTYKNHWCAYAALGFGILAGLTAHWLRRRPDDLLRGSPVPLALVGLAILAASVPLSGSALGILLILAIGIPFVGFLCHHFLPRCWGWRRGLLSCSIALLLPAISAWMVLASDSEIKRETLQKVTARWQSLREGRMPWRYYHSKDSWAMFMDKPLWGWGLGSTATLYPLYVSDEIIQQSEQILANAHHDERFFGLEHSHNDWFQYLAETGSGGVVLLTLAPLLALRRICFSRSLGTWVLLACGALALFSFVDFPSRTPACAILFAVTLGCSLKYASRSSGSNF